jgi:hypothetical protein
MTSVQEGSYFPEDVSKYKLCRQCAERLVMLCRECNAKVAVSSNWRKFDKDGFWLHGGSRYYNPLSAFIDAIREVYICTLPSTRHVPKSAAVAKWISENKAYIDNYVVLDDDLNEGFQSADIYGIKDHFVHVDRQFGLTDADCKKAAKILNSSF